MNGALMVKRWPGAVSRNVRRETRCHDTAARVLFWLQLPNALKNKDAMPTRPPQHRPPHWKEPVAWQRPAGETTTKRGYGARWQKLRALVLSREPWCRPCRDRYEHTKATQVDHIVPKAEGGTDDPSNLQAICFRCHRAKSSKEGNRAR